MDIGPQLYKENQMFECDKNISNSLLIHQVNHDHDGVWISDQLLSLDFYGIFLRFISIDNIYQTPKTVFDHKLTSKFIFTTLFSVFENGKHCLSCCICIT